MRTLKTLGACLSILTAGLFSCRTIPEGAKAVTPFYKDKYLGKWYEIARIDFKFEKGLNNTTAEYSLNSDGSIKVLNKGFDTTANKWKEAEGKARFVKDANTGMLEVSFFGPFYSGYNVLAVDPDYRYALVGGADHDYLWILSRETTIPENIKDSYLQIAKENGYETNRLLWVGHGKE